MTAQAAPLRRAERALAIPPARLLAAVLAAVATLGSAFALAAEAAATALVAVTLGLAHHCGGTFLQLIDADGEITDDVFVDAFLTLDLGDHCCGAVDVEQHEVSLAVLVHAIGEGAHAPVLGLGDLAAETFDHAGNLRGEFLNLLGARILTREKNMLVKRHGSPFQC